MSAVFVAPPLAGWPSLEPGLSGSACLHCPCLQVELKFANYEHQHSMEYTVTAIAVNEFGESKPSKAVTYTTPRRPDTPVIDSVEVLPPTDREPFGAIAVTVTETDDGGSRE